MTIALFRKSEPQNHNIFYKAKSPMKINSFSHTKRRSPTELKLAHEYKILISIIQAFVCSMYDKDNILAPLLISLMQMLNILFMESV